MANVLLVTANDLARRHGVRTLFEGISFGVTEGERIAIVGPNGSGKTTLLRLLAGLETPDAGTVTRRRLITFGFVEQSPDLAPGLSAHDIVTAGLADLGLEEYEQQARVGEALGRAGIDDDTVLAGTLSGGWRKRLALARELAREPDLLLLDEPTNHLDIEGILWLEELLAARRQATIFVSHDRWFLQHVATRVMELSRSWAGGLFTSAGSYADFLEKRDEALAGQEQYRASLANVVRREVEWLRRGPKARTTKAESRIKEAGRLQSELAEVTSRTRTQVTGVDFSASDRKTKRLVVAEGAGVTLGGRRILSGVDLTLINGSRLGILGRNGSGKTTLLRLITGELEPTEGTIRRADGLAIARLEQERDTLDLSLSLARALAPEGDAVNFRGEQVHVSSWARRFLFRADQLQVPVAQLSGGERARILVARLMLRPADLLLLDEPTNDLDIATLEALEENLETFPGALVLVTHDRYLLDRVSTTLVAVEEGGRVEPYADLAQWQAARTKAPATGARGSSSRKGGGKAARASKRMSFLEQREWAGMEALILSAEGVVTAAAAAAGDPSIRANASKLQERHAALAAAESAVARLYARWAELEALQG